MYEFKSNLIEKGNPRILNVDSLFCQIVQAEFSKE